MKKFLPIFIFAILIGLFFVKTPVFAEQTLDQAPVAPDDSWVKDPEVTFIGKNAARSGNLLDFTLQNYNWVCVRQGPNGQCDDSNNPLTAVWLTSVTYIVVPLLFIVILATAIIIIVTRGRSLTIMRFLPRFVAVILLIFFSFAIIQFFYQFFDVIQGFFLRSHNDPCPSNIPYSCISQRDLLFVGWDYGKFEGLRLVGDKYTESAFISLLLTKLTALTYFVMVGILFLRRVILWLFIIVSPIFPLLLLYYPIRNTGKIWIGEFFRWLLYAPLFAIFLKGLVSLWRSGIPLLFTTVSHTDSNLIVYPTAVNILLGGPKEFVTLTNSVNLTETFALYVVSLLMLWGVIILPWILLQIFLDYASNIGVGDSAIMKNMVGLINRQGPPPVTPHSPSSGGSEISMPIAKKFNMPLPPSTPTGMAREIPISTSRANVASYMPSAQVKARVLSLANTTLPSMRDIAKYDTSLISRDSTASKEAITIRDNLIKIGNPESSSSSSEKEKYVQIRESLVKESNSGNTLASSILTAASTASKTSSRATTSQIKSMLTQIANPQAAATAGASSIINREKLSKMNDSLVNAKKQGNTLASSILAVNEKTSSAEIEKLQEKIMDAKAKGEPVAVQLEAALQKKDTLPVVNRVQTVSREDYQAVKDMWKENYRNLEVPEGMAGTRAEWVKDDMTKIDNIIALLDSKDEEKMAKGMEEVSSILPFLLVGGFSQTEIVAYLKAKQEAAKEVAAEIVQDDEEKVEVKVKKTTTVSQTMTASIAEDTDDSESDISDIQTVPTVKKFITTPAVSDEILKISNLELPRITDIVKYEMRSLTKDKTESQRIEKMQSILEKIGNPQAIATPQERAEYENLREKLGKESINGNTTASVILSAVSQLSGAISELNVTLEDMKKALTQIANPQSVTDADDRDYYKRLHDYLEKESVEKKNVLAQQILNVNESTKPSDIQSIKEGLVTTQGNDAITLPEITKAVKESTNVNRLRTIINQISSPQAQALVSDSQIFNTINKSLNSEKIKGSKIANSVFSVNDNTSESDLRQVHAILKEGKEKNDLLSSSILSQVSDTPDFVSSHPEIIKTVLKQIAAPDSLQSVEDKKYYTNIQEEVKKEGNENYNTLAQKLLTINDLTTPSDFQQIKEQLVNEKDPFSKQIMAKINEYAELQQLREVINQSVHPKLSSESNTDSISKLRSSISEESKKGNPLAASILSINGTASEVSLMRINQQLAEASKKGDPTAQAILSQVTDPLGVSTGVRMQEVTPEEYEEAKELWKKAYMQYFVPQGFTEDVKGRLEWISKDIKDIEETIGILQSSDPEHRNAGIKKVSGILPFLLLGGFSSLEMIKYLQTKAQAAREAQAAIEEDEEKSVQVSTKKDEKLQEMQANDDSENDSNKK